MVLANQTLSDDSEKNTQLFSKPVHPNLGVEQQFCPHAHIVDVSGHRESEVDARNILPETLACSRVLTTRKRTAIEERYTKKVKKPYLQDSYDSGPLIDVTLTRNSTLRCSLHLVFIYNIGAFIHRISTFKTRNVMTRWQTECAGHQLKGGTFGECTGCRTSCFLSATLLVEHESAPNSCNFVSLMAFDECSPLKFRHLIYAIAALKYIVVDLRDLAGTRTCLNLRFMTNCVMATVGPTVIPYILT
ncbi:hypothetical protein B0H13DRAFT_1899867 [Mycena leptocephala]|nr:hypothetical protein B0H13DRAFT_1899867 [Mycena leptocephala]